MRINHREGASRIAKCVREPEIRLRSVLGCFLQARLIRRKQVKYGIAVLHRETHITRRTPFIKSAEILLHRLWCENFIRRCFIQHIARNLLPLSYILQSTEILIFQRKEPNDPALHLPMAIAASRRLCDGGESGKSTIDHRKGYIDTRLNELRADTDKPLLWIFMSNIKLLPHSTQNFLTVGRAHLRAEMHNMNISFRNLHEFRDFLVEVARLFREVYDAKDITDLLRTMHDFAGNFINGNAAILADILNLHSSKALKHLC